MNDLLSYIKEYALILVPALYIIGMILKGLGNIADKYIPIILLIFGIAGSIGMNGLSIDSAIQGILVTGVAVYSNQLIKQIQKNE